MLITDLPVETIDHIAAALDASTDIKNLAAVCTQLHLLLSPHHTQFRVIRAPLILPIWKEIAENRLFAKNIRVLEIQSAEPEGYDYHEHAELDKPVIPAIFQELEVPSDPIIDDDDNEEATRRYDAEKNAMDLDAERSLVSALKGMSGLTSFRWARTPPLINPNREDDIWITLAKYSTSLNTIDVLDREKPCEPVLEEDDDPAYQRPSFNPNFYSFKDLKSFSFHTEAFNVGNFTFPNVEKCAEMLVKCPNLEVLKLEYILFANPNTETVPASSFFFGPRWTSLRELTLLGFEFISTELASCLVSHPTIEILSLTSIHIDQSLVLPPGVLPRLKRLATDMRLTLINSILDSSTSAPRPLEDIQGASLDDVFLNSLEHSGSGPNLRSLISEVSGHGFNHLISRLAGIAPNLEHLTIPAKHSLKYLVRSSDSTRFHSQDHRCEPTFSFISCCQALILPIEVIGQLPCLRSLRGVQLVDSACEPPSKNTETIRALVTVCPNIQRISWYAGYHVEVYNSGVLIERNGSHVTWSVRRKVKGVEVGNSVDSYCGERSCGSFQL